MSRIILRTKNNGVFTGVRKDLDPSVFGSGLLITVDPKTGLLMWCPQDQIDEVIELPIEMEEDGAGG